MSGIRIHLKNDIWTSQTSQVIDTTFYLENYGEFFPDDQWTDLTYPVIDIWAQQIISYKNNPSGKVELFFMDGPYKLIVRKTTVDMLAVQCVNFRDQPLCEMEFECSYRDFFDMLLVAVKDLDRILYEHELNGKQIREVRAQLRWLRSRLREEILRC